MLYFVCVKWVRWAINGTRDRRKQSVKKSRPRKPGCFSRLLVLGFRWHRHVRFLGNFALYPTIHSGMDDPDLLFPFLSVTCGSSISPESLRRALNKPNSRIQSSKNENYQVQTKNWLNCKLNAVDQNQQNT